MVIIIILIAFKDFIEAEDQREGKRRKISLKIKN